jgi:hypothetical protein
MSSRERITLPVKNITAVLKRFSFRERPLDIIEASEKNPERAA